MPKAIARTERVQLRLRPEQKALLERAARYADQSLSRFLLEAGAREAEQVVERRETIRLSERDWADFLSLIEGPSPSAPGLEKAARRHRQDAVRAEDGAS